MSVNDFEGQDYFDSRNVEERIQELESERDEAGSEFDEDDAAELAELIDFRDDVRGDEWSYGITFISEDHFEEYARELAELIDFPDEWPCTFIDWAAATDALALKMDYTSVEFGSTTYYYR